MNQLYRFGLRVNIVRNVDSLDQVMVGFWRGLLDSADLTVDQLQLPLQFFPSNFRFLQLQVVRTFQRKHGAFDGSPMEFRRVREALGRYFLRKGSLFNLTLGLFHVGQL